MADHGPGDKLVTLPALSEFKSQADAAYAGGATVPTQASISNTGLVSFKNSNGTSLFTLQLPLYAGGVS